MKRREWGEDLRGVMNHVVSRFGMCGVFWAAKCGGVERLSRLIKFG